MQKLSNFTGQARHGWEKMTPAAFGMGRPSADTITIPPIKRSLAPAQVPSLTPENTIIHLSFNIPFASSLTGPNANEILHASPGAFQRWTHAADAGEAPPTHKLPVHVRNVDDLKKLCKFMGESSGGQLEATVTSMESKPAAPSQRRTRKGLVTNVCVTASGAAVYKMRAKILNETPIALVD